MLRHTVLLASIAVAVSVLNSTGAIASAQRTFVASYGSPANIAFNCSIAKPCRAFSDATSVTNDKGEVIVLDSAGYGTVTITKSVAIIAPPGVYAGITVFAPDDGVTVNAPGGIVVLRGLSINGQGGFRGIVFQAGERLRVENCVVSGMTNAGIWHDAANGEMIVLDSITRDNGGAGIFANGDSVSVVLDHVRSEHNQADGFALGGSSFSVVAVVATVSNSVFTHNLGRGIWAAVVSDGASATIVVERSVISNNSNHGFVATILTFGSSRATLSRNTIVDNLGAGVWIYSNTLGQAIAEVFENVVHRNGGDDLISDGGEINASGNQLTYGVCANGGKIFTYQNNAAPAFSPGCASPLFMH